MIEFTKDQEQTILRQDCRDWIGQIAPEWYASGHPDAADYPPDDLNAHLQAVYFACDAAGIDELADTTLLAFNVLRANTLGYDAGSVEQMVIFFIAHVKGDNVDYAQNWIDLNFEEVQ